MITLEQLVKDNEDIVKELFKSIFKEEEKHIVSLDIEIMGRDVVGSLICSFRDDPEIDKLFKGNDDDWEIYNELKDRRHQEHRINYKEVIDYIKVEVRDKKIDQILKINK